MNSFGLLLAMATVAAPMAGVDPAKCVLGDDYTEAQGAATMCGFDWASLQFAGTAVEQARCLTRHVGMSAHIGGPELPAGLAGLVGRNTDITPAALADYLRSQGVGDAQIGGPLNQPVAAQYFIIHDTSYPNCSNPEIQSTPVGRAYCPVLDAFPADRDQAGWRANQDFTSRPRNAPDREANVYVNRVGASITEDDFADATFYTTKFEKCEHGGAAVGRFVGVENIQPRLAFPRPTPRGRRVNDREAPTPGFTGPQYNRLALLYIIASVRHGSWMIPAYHAVIDNYYSDNHDDPQNFDIVQFDAAITAQLTAIRGQ